MLLDLRDTIKDRRARGFLVADVGCADWAMSSVGGAPLNEAGRFNCFLLAGMESAVVGETGRVEGGERGRGGADASLLSSCRDATDVVVVVMAAAASTVVVNAGSKSGGAGAGAGAGSAGSDCVSGAMADAGAESACFSPAVCGAIGGWDGPRIVA